MMTRPPTESCPCRKLDSDRNAMILPHDAPGRIKASEKEAVWSEDRSAKRASPGKSDQSHGRATPNRSVDAERGGRGEGERRAAASRRTPKKAARSNARKRTG